MTEEPFRTIIEPFRIHSVEPMRLTNRSEGAGALAAAGYNLFELPPAPKTHGRTFPPRRPARLAGCKRHNGSQDPVRRIPT